MWDETGSVEKSRFNLSNSEIFLNSSLDQVPADDFNNVLGFVDDFDLMESKVCPVVSLSDVGLVEVVTDVVVATKVVGGVYE